VETPAELDCDGTEGLGDGDRQGIETLAEGNAMNDTHPQGAARDYLAELRRARSSCYRALRLIMLMSLLDDRGFSTAELAIVLKVSRRTVRRDLNVIQGEPLYYPLTYDRDFWRKMP
jgi:predicted DNA-binding transcriptional regulator YafY